jgi:LysR family glycine cleavage system transcriptional activator
MRDLPPLNAVRVFEAAARHENFSRAAEELNVTQSAVSRQIQHLEEQLSCSLFVRSGPRLTLTQTGREYQAIIQNGLSIIRRGTHRLFGSQTRPVITISSVPSLVSRWLVPRLVDFEQKNPDVSVRLNATFHKVDFAIETDIDAGIRFGEGRWSGLVSELLVDEVMFPVCSPEIARRLERPADLVEQRLLVEDPNWDLWSYWLKAVGLASLPNAGDRLSEDYNVQLQAAALGHGVALGRSLLAADDLRAGRLVCPFKVSVRSPIQYFFVCPPERLNEPIIARTLDWLRSAARETVTGLEAWSGRCVE